MRRVELGAQADELHVVSLALGAKPLIGRRELEGMALREARELAAEAARVLLAKASEIGLDLAEARVALLDRTSELADRAIELADAPGAALRRMGCLVALLGHRLELGRESGPLRLEVGDGAPDLLGRLELERALPLGKALGLPLELRTVRRIEGRDVGGVRGIDRGKTRLERLPLTTRIRLRELPRGALRRDQIPGAQGRVGLVAGAADFLLELDGTRFGESALTLDRPKPLGKVLGAARLRVGKRAEAGEFVLHRTELALATSVTSLERRGVLGTDALERRRMLGVSLCELSCMRCLLRLELRLPGLDGVREPTSQSLLEARFERCKLDTRPLDDRSALGRRGGEPPLELGDDGGMRRVAGGEFASEPLLEPQHELLALARYALELGLMLGLPRPELQAELLELRCELAMVVAPIVDGALCQRLVGVYGIEPRDRLGSALLEREAHVPKFDDLALMGDGLSARVEELAMPLIRLVSQRDELLLRTVESLPKALGLGRGGRGLAREGEFPTKLGELDAGTAKFGDLGPKSLKLLVRLEQRVPQLRE